MKKDAVCSADAASKKQFLDMRTGSNLSDWVFRTRVRALHVS